MDTGVSAPQETMTTSEVAVVPGTVLLLEAGNWTVVDYKSRYTDRINVCRFNAMSFDGPNAIIYHRRGVKRHTEIGGWNRRWSLMRSCCPGYLDPMGLLDMRFVPNGNESSYVHRFVAQIDCAEEMKGLMTLDAWCLDRPYDQYYLIHDAESWSWKTGL